MSNVALEVAIGLVFAFWALSLAAAGITEAISSLISKRGAELARGLAAMLGGDGPAPWNQRVVQRMPWVRKVPVLGRLLGSPPRPGDLGRQAPRPTGLVEEVLDHALVAAMGRPPRKGKPSTSTALPSYISSATFARVLLDALDPRIFTSRAERRRALAALPSSTGKQLEAVLADVQGDVAAARTAIEGWFNAQMDRVSGWYKRWAKKVAFVVGLGLVIVLNADAITMTTTLWRDPAVRAALVAQADAACPEPAEGAAEGAVEADCTVAVEKLAVAGLPLGWDCPGGEEESTPAWHHCIDDVGEGARTLVGWLITAGAISLGAPFWFDTLGRISSLRSAGRKPERGKDD